MLRKLLARLRAALPRSFPEPATKRTDLYYGYYGSNSAQVDEVKGHTNVWMESNFSGVHNGILNILNAQMPTILDVSGWLFTGTPHDYVCKPEAKLHLRWFFDQHRTAGTLKYIKYLYPVDEPNLLVRSEGEYLKGLAALRDVQAEYEELKHVPTMQIYTTLKGAQWWGRDEHAIIGFDDYGRGTKVLYNEHWDQLVKGLKPHQRIVLVPGGSYGQEPEPFVNFAHTDRRVAMIMPFLWMDATGEEHNSNAPGIRSHGLRDRYVLAGKALTGK